MRPYLLRQLGFPRIHGWSHSRDWGEQKQDLKPRKWKNSSATEEGFCCLCHHSLGTVVRFLALRLPERHGN